MNIFNVYITFLLVLLNTGCSPVSRTVCYPATINCISIVDRDGFTSTIQSRDRLAQYSCVDFLAPQAYQKVMVVYARDACGNIPAYITSYYSNGHVKQYLDLMNARACGCYREWHDNGVLKLDCKVIGGLGDLTEEAYKSWLFDETCQAWDLCGRLQATIRYEKGWLEGESLYYHSNGNLRRRVHYCRGLIEGMEEFFTESGDLLEASTYSHGEQEGKTVRYWSPDQLAAEEWYQKGKLLSGCYFDSSGKKVCEVERGHGFRALFDETSVRHLQEYRYGMPEGESKILDSTGRLCNLYHVKGGKKQGEEIVYFPPEKGNPNSPLIPRLSIMWNEDKIHGVVRSWYPNGASESQREMSNNVRNGLCTAWYRNGNIMLVEEYDHDKLVKGEYFKKGERRPESRVTDGSGLATLYDGEGNLIQKVHYHHGHILD